MKWNKLGQVFTVLKCSKEVVSHASNPVALHLNDNIFRIFFSTRNLLNKSSVSYVDIDILSLKIINNPQKVIFSYGTNNSFYSHGVSIGNFYADESKSYILFMGWKIKENEHWKGEVGRLELLNKEDL